jgi:hypothetical protein
MEEAAMTVQSKATPVQNPRPSPVKSPSTGGLRRRAKPDDGMSTLDKITLAGVTGGVLAVLLLWYFLRAEGVSNDMQAAALRDFRSLPDGVSGDSVKLVALSRPGPPDIDAWFTLEDGIGSTASGTRTSLNQVWHQAGIAFRVIGRVANSDTDLEIQIIRPGDSMHRAVDGARATISFPEFKALVADANTRLREAGEGG